MVRAARTGYRSTLRDRSRRHGPGRQQADRNLERRVRIRALARARWARWHRWRLPDIATELGISAATLRDWQRRWDDPHDRLKPRPLGAPALTSAPAERRAVLDFLAIFGTQVSVTILHQHFPHLARRDLACLLHRSRLDHDAIAAGATYRCVTWNGAGRVWAMDHTEPPSPIDGIFPSILTVRDLASGAVLASHAVQREDAHSTIALLDDLRARHGAPLVLKADNGPAFAAQATGDYLDRIGTVLLRSPPYCPSYNGACEAGNGTIKRLTHDLAVRHDRPHSWTLDDLEAARLLANRRITDRRQTRTPEQRFADRIAITNEQRSQLADAVNAARHRRLAQATIAFQHTQSRIAPDALDRQAITDALTGLGYITIRCRSVRLCNPLRDVG